MSIASRITEMETHISNAYTSIDNLGIDISNTNKNIYNISTLLDTFYERLPKVSGIGASLSLSPSLMGKIKLNEIQGDTLQKNTPTPSSPVPIQSVTGLQNVEVCGKNLFNKDTATILDLYIDGGVLKESSYNKLLYIPCKPNTTYTLQKIASPNSRQIAYTKELPKLNVNVYGTIDISANATSGTITTGNDAKYLVCRFYQVTQDASTPLENMKNSIQIELGSTATTYEPYKGNTYEVNLGNIELNKIGDYKDSIKKSTGKNLFNLYDKTTTNYNGVDVTIENGELTLNGTTTSGTSILGIGIFNHITDITYTCSFVYESGSCTDYGGGIFFSDTSTGTINVGGGGGFRANQGRSFTLNDIGTKPYYAYMVLNNRTTYTNYKIRFQIEQNSQATTYEPYGKVWYIEKNIGKVVLDGSEYVLANKDMNYVYQFLINDYANKTNINDNDALVMSNYFKYKKGDPTSTTNEDYIWQFQYYLVVDIRKTITPTLNDFKTWLSTNKPTINYILATPTYTEITNEELINQLESLNNAKSKDGTTNIIVTSEDLSMILNVSVIKGDA